MMHQQQAMTPPAAPPLATPVEARKFAEGMLGIMDTLLGVVDRETELVRAGNVRQAMTLEAEKSEASRRYTQAIAQLAVSRDYLARSAPDLLTALRRQHETFRAMLQVNLTVLATAHAVSEGIVRGVNGELQRRALPNGYTAGGQRAVPGPRQVTPLTVSRSL